MKKFIIFLFTLVVFVACKDSDTVIPGPQIQDIEVGSNNSKTVQRGKDLHLEAQVVAEAGIEKARISIHPTSGAEGWTWSREVPELEGKKNGEIHLHIQIPADVKPGSYHVDIEVKDKAGKVAEAESDLSITE
jgi:uncharacterized membrane protein